LIARLFRQQATRTIFDGAKHETQQNKEHADGSEVAGGGGNVVNHLFHSRRVVLNQPCRDGNLFPTALHKACRFSYFFQIELVNADSQMLR